MKKKVNYAQDKFYLLFVFIFLAAAAVLDVIRNLTAAFFPSLAFLDTLVRNGMYILCGLYVVYLFIRYGIDRFDLILAVVSVAFWGVSALLTPVITTFWKPALMLFYSRVYIGVVLLRHMEDHEGFVSLMKWAIPFFFVDAVAAFLSPELNYMTFSVGLMSFALLYIFAGQYKQSRLLEGMGFFFFYSAAFLGARGSLLAGVVTVIAYVILMLFNKDKSVIRRNVTHLLIGFSVMILVHLILTADYKALFGVDFNFMEFIRRKSRTTTLISTGQVATDSNRFGIYERGIKGILKNPLLPRGFLSDRVEIATTFLHYSKHAHNMIIEVFIQFGIPLGLCFLGALAYAIIRKIKDIPAMNRMQFLFLLAFFPAAAVQVMLSSSYLVHWIFAAALGMILAQTQPVEAAQEPSQEAATAEVQDETNL